MKSSMHLFNYILLLTINEGKSYNSARYKVYKAQDVLHKIKLHMSEQTKIEHPACSMESKKEDEALVLSQKLVSEHVLCKFTY